MATKEPVERKFVAASEAKKDKTSESAPKKEAVKRETPEEKPAPKKPAKEEAPEAAEETEKPAKKPNYEEVAPDHGDKTPKQRATGLRIGAWVLWIVGIVFEVLAILILNGTMYVPKDKTMLFLIGAIVLDLIAVIVASQLWKKSNRIDPASKANKLKFFLWNNMGVIMSIIAFLPLLILLLKDKDMDAKTKKIVSAIAAVAMLAAVGTSIDYHPVSQEDLAQAKEESVELGDGTAYWTQFGRSYHFNPDCQAIKNSANVYYGTVEEAFEAKRTDPCDFCAIDKATGEALQPAA